MVKQKYHLTKMINRRFISKEAKLFFVSSLLLVAYNFLHWIITRPKGNSDFAGIYTHWFSNWNVAVPLLESLGG